MDDEKVVYPARQMKASLAPDYVALGNDLMLEDLKSTVKNKLTKLKGDLINSGEKLDHERYLREEAEKRAKYFEKKAGLVNVYSREGQGDPGVRREMNEEMHPLKRRRRRHKSANLRGKDKLAGYDTNDSRFFSDRVASDVTSHKLRVSPKFQPQELKMGISTDMETTEAETTDYYGYKGRHNAGRLPRRNNVHNRVTSDSEVDGYSSAVNQPNFRGEEPFLKRLSEERSSELDSIRSGSVEEMEILEENLSRAETRIQSLKYEVDALQNRNSELSKLLKRRSARQKLGKEKDISLALVDGNFHDVDADLKNLKLMQDLKNEELESKVAARVADIVEEIHDGQKRRDEALLKQVREARSDREQLLKQVHSLQKQVHFLQQTPDERLENRVKDDTNPTVEELLRQVEEASSGLEIEVAGSALLDKVIESQKAVVEVRDEELAFVIGERNEAVEKLKELETYFFSVDKFTHKERAQLPSDDRVSRALKTELQHAAKVRDGALSQVELLREELESIKDFLASKTPDGGSILDEMQSKFKSGEDPRMHYLEKLSRQLSERVKTAQEENSKLKKSSAEHEKMSAELQNRNEQH